MNLTSEADLQRLKLNKHVKYLVSRLCRWEVIVWRHRHTHSRVTTLLGPLTVSNMRLWRLLPWDTVPAMSKNRFQPSGTTPIEHIENEIATLVTRWVGKINAAVAVDVEVIQEAQRTAIYLNSGRKQKMCVTCIKRQLILTSNFQPTQAV